MTPERDGKSRRTGQPDLLASLPAERPPASQPAPGFHPAAIEELVTGVRDLREQFAVLRQLEAADRPAPVPAALTPEALEAWGDKLVSRVAEAARTADAPGDEAAATRIKRMEDAAAKAAAAAERIDGGLEGTAEPGCGRDRGGRHHDEREPREDASPSHPAVPSGRSDSRSHQDTRGWAEVRLADGLRVLDRLRRGACCSRATYTCSTDGCEPVEPAAFPLSASAARRHGLIRGLSRW